jgi:hypothetical protein
MPVHAASALRAGAEQARNSSTAVGTPLMSHGFGDDVWKYEDARVTRWSVVDATCTQRGTAATGGSTAARRA